MPDPTYEVVDDATHRATFPGSQGGSDDSSIIITRIRMLNDEQVEAEVCAAVGDQIITRSRFRLLNDIEVYRFCQAAAANNSSIDWFPRYVWTREQLLEIVRTPAEDDTVTEKTPERWPALSTNALYGIVGELTLAIDPYTEADHVAVLSNLLTGAGNLLGSQPHFRVEHTKHPLRLFITHVGETAKGRKGTGWSTPYHVFRQIDSDWAKDRVTGGMSSGEGLIYNVRDERWEKQPVKQKGRVVDYQMVLIDAGVKDKRLMLVEEEFSQALKVMKREGNILSQIIRQAWDTGDLHPLVKNDPTVATGAHISVIGHITIMELLRHFSEVEMANGYGNRFIWLLVRRSKMISNPVGVPDTLLNPLVQELIKAITRARQLGEMCRDPDAQKWWDAHYEAISADKAGLLGALLARSEMQVMRMAAIYAALDGTALITCDHLKAAMALWRYAEESVKYIFGVKTGDPIADRIIAALDQEGQLDMTAISLLFDRNMEAEKIHTAIAFLDRLQMIAIVKIKPPKRGRPTTIVQRL